MNPQDPGDGSWRVEPRKVDPSVFARKNGSRRQKHNDSEFVAFIRKYWWAIAAVCAAFVLMGIYRQPLVKPLVYVIEGIR
jgi:hypothetical protein